MSDVKNVVEEKKEEVEKVAKKIKEKEIKETPVHIYGLSEAEAQAVNTVILHIENTKALPKGQFDGATKELQQIEEELDLFQHVEQELNAFNNTTKTYRDVVKKIKALSELREKLEKYIEFKTAELKAIDDTIAKIKSNIRETDNLDGVHINYDKKYFEAFLDLAYVTFDVAPTKDGNVELKVKK